MSATVTDAVAISSVQFYLDGRPLGTPVTQAPYAVSWNTREVPNGPHTLTAAATDAANNIGYAAPVEVTVENPLQKPPCFVVDATASAEGSTRVTAPPITTGEAGEQLFAFVSADGPAGAGQQAATISGGGVAWRLLARANSQPGDAEIWTAQAHKPLKRKRIKSTLTSRRYDQLLTVIAVQMSNGAGASASAGAASGTPAVSMLTSEEGSLVYGVGSDWSGAAPRSPGVNQVLLHEQLDARSGKTFWSQYLGEISGPAGEVVTLNDTAPNGDRWNMASVEIRGDGPGN